MADIRPFHGAHYNPEVVDLAEVVCPPHDIISPQLQLELYQRSEFNFVRIELGREFPRDSEVDNRYVRAAAALESWLRRGVLAEDVAPSLYIDEHSFTYRGRQYRRRGISCLVKLADWHEGVVRPHEGTFSGPKSDRLNLLQVLRANTSPIMMLFEDPARGISGRLEEATGGPPVLAADGIDGEGHRVWAVSDAAAVDEIRRALAGQPLYIADGHHRYESALAYRRARRAGSPGDGEQPFDFILTTLVDFADPGLVILPAHRLVRGVAPALVEGLIENLKTCFSVEPVPAEGDIPGRIDNILASQEGEVRLAMYGPRGAMSALTLRDCDTVAALMPYFHSGLYSQLDVSIVDDFIVGELLGAAQDPSGASLDYTHDAAEAVRRVNEGEAQLAFVVKPVNPGAIKAFADAGDRMPRKSTYFYPKIPAGLVFYRFS